MIKYPLVTKVTPKEDLILEVEFNNGIIKEYDCKQLLDDEVYQDLLSPYLFMQVAVDCGGHAIAWNSEVDISEVELWENGITKEM